MSPHTFLTAELLGGHDGGICVLDVLLRFLPNKESWLVDKLVLDRDVAVGNKSTSVVDRVCKSALVNLCLETAIHKIVDCERKDIIELLLGLIENTELCEAAKKSCTFEDTLGIVLWEGKKLTSSVADLGKCV